MRITMAVLTMALWTSLLPAEALGQVSYAFKVIHQFNDNVSDGNAPMGGIVLDAEGNLWGTTLSGGSYGLGIAWELAAGTRKETIRRFNSHNGSHPIAGLSGSGVYYGTTQTGGGDKCNCGTVFGMVNGEQSVLHVFKNGEDGEWPEVGIAEDGQGNLYGQSTAGLFEITAGGGFTMIFNGGVGSFAVDAAGDVFYTDSGGNLQELGVGVLYTFASGDVPQGLAVSADGSTVTGITQYGGTGYGSIWQWTAQGGEADLYDFPESAEGISNPTIPVTFDGNGNAFGVTVDSGPLHKTFGTVWEVQLGTQNPPAVLHQFQGTNDGYRPQSPVILDGAGDVYGTASAGGSHLRGTIWELVGQ
jgi:hypothetical protein